MLKRSIALCKIICPWDKNHEQVFVWNIHMSYFMSVFGEKFISDCVNK